MGCLSSKPAEPAQHITVQQLIIVQTQGRNPRSTQLNRQLTRQESAFLFGKTNPPSAQKTVAQKASTSPEAGRIKKFPPSPSSLPSTPHSLEDLMNQSGQHSTTSSKTIELPPLRTPTPPPENAQNPLARRPSSEDDESIRQFEEFLKNRSEVQNRPPNGVTRIASNRSLSPCVLPAQVPE